MIGTERGTGWKIVGYLGMALAILFIGVPLVWIVLTSFKSHGEIYSVPAQWWPTEFRWENYRDVFTRVAFADYFINSIVITVVLCTIKIILGVISAYALAILRFPGRNIVFVIVISALMVPSEVTVISNYALASQLGWRDTYTGIIVPLAGIAFGTFLMRNHFMAIPREIVEAARMDGAGPFRLLAETTRSATLPVGLTMLQNNDGISNWGPVMAATIMTMIPVLLLFLALNKYMIKGLTSGAVKG